MFDRMALDNLKHPLVIMLTTECRTPHTDSETVARVVTIIDLLVDMVKSIRGGGSIRQTKALDFHDLRAIMHTLEIKDCEFLQWLWLYNW